MPTLLLPPSVLTIKHATSAVRSRFFISGALFATLGVHVPAVKAHYALGEQGLAVAMMSASAGAVLALTQAGRIVGRFGSRSVSLVAGMVGVGAIAMLLTPQSHAALLALMLLFGAGASLFDLSITAQASELERLSRRPLMSGVHGFFSLGGMAGAATGGALLGWGLDGAQNLLFAGALFIAAMAAGHRAMLPVVPPAALARRWSLPAGRLLLLGLLAALGLIAEGAIYDWSVLFMRQEAHSDAVTATMAYAAFSAAMAAGRFGGDWVRVRCDAVALLQWSGMLAAVGMAIALFVSVPSVALPGFALAGLGMSNVVPTLFSAAAKMDGMAPAQGIAAVSSLGYVGMMAGPTWIGVVAQRSSLTLAMLTVVALSMIQVVGARRALGYGA